MKGITAGYAMCGSFCTMAHAVEQIPVLLENGIDVVPIMSQIVYESNNRFTKAAELRTKISEMTGKEIIHTIEGAEPIGPKKLLDIIIVAPCTGNTTAKIALGITDTPVTLAVKAHLRNNRPVVLGIATNDALGASAKNIGLLHNTKNIYFVPFGQDDPHDKNNSLISDFAKLKSTAESALIGKQIQPILLR